MRMALAPRKFGMPLLRGALILGALYVTSYDSYLLFHSLVEVFTVAVAWSIFFLAWNSRRYVDNHYWLFVGIASLFVSLMDLLHMLAFKGMGVFPDVGANLATQLWIAARYVQSLSLLLAPLYLRRRLNTHLAFAGFGLVFALLLASIFVWHIFPECYVEGTGLTPFKIASEYLIILILLASEWLLFRQRNAFDPAVWRSLLLAIGLIALAELIFTLYITVYDFSNLTGHLVRLVAFYGLYQTIIVTGLVKPYDLLFRNLRQNGQELQKAKEQLEVTVAERTEELRRANAQLNEELEERKRAEQQVQQLNAELEQRVVERTAELQAAYKELEAFSYSVSHDLRAPLSSIKGFSNLLLQDYVAELPEEGRLFIRLIHDNTTAMEQLVQGLLTLSRAGRQALKKDTVCMTDLVRQVLTELRSTDDGRAHEIALADIPASEADPVLIKQVWFNLLSNAFKFTRQRDPVRIEIGFQDSGDGAYYVKDNGVGFDPACADKLFGVFQRLHSEDDYPGTGVGLAIVDRIVRRHGGRVWAQGCVDHGATFYFTLPRTA